VSILARLADSGVPDAGPARPVWTRSDVAGRHAKEFILEFSAMLNGAQTGRADEGNLEAS
jgi:hypothetical protein